MLVTWMRGEGRWVETSFQASEHH